MFIGSFLILGYEMEGKEIPLKPENDSAERAVKAGLLKIPVTKLTHRTYCNPPPPSRQIQGSHSKPRQAPHPGTANGKVSGAPRRLLEPVDVFV